MTLHAPTLWDWDGLAHAWAQPRVRALLEVARPPIVTLHATPRGLAQDAPKIAREVRETLGARVWLAVAGDVGAPRPQWRDIPAIAIDCDADLVEPDCEPAWIGAGDAAARAAIDQLADLACPLGFTTYGGVLRVPNPMPPPTIWGRGGDYPLRGFLGYQSRVKYLFPQVYWEIEGGVKMDYWGKGLRALARCNTSWDVAVATDLVAPGIERNPYVQLHGCRTDNLCAVAVTGEFAQWWPLNAKYLDVDGERALRACCELARRGFKGGNAIIDFQRSEGLIVDNRVGPRTLAALGIST